MRAQTRLHVHIHVCLCTEHLLTCTGQPSAPAGVIFPPLIPRLSSAVFHRTDVTRASHTPMFLIKTQRGRKEGGGGGRRKDGLLTEEEPGGRCVSVSYLAALFTSFASSDVVGKKLFLKAHLKRLRCYKIQHPHVFLCVCACQQAS